MNEGKTREFVMTDADFAQIRKLAIELTGISLSEHKREMVYSRLARRLRSLNMYEFSNYITYLQSNKTDEVANFVNSITTNLTSFFREKHHFEYLGKTVVPELVDHHKNDKKIRIWSAGCSTGEEPYSIAMTLIESTKLPSPQWDVRILATDLDSNVLSHAKNALYSENSLSTVDSAIKSRWFNSQRSGDKNTYQVAQKVRDLVTFNHLNLMQSWPLNGKFDVIFCRNVVIYFDKPTQKILFERYAESLNDGGFLFIGHSETLHGLTSRFKPLGRTIYRKVH